MTDIVVAPVELTTDSIDLCQVENGQSRADQTTAFEIDGNSPSHNNSHNPQQEHQKNYIVEPNEVTRCSKFCGCCVGFSCLSVIVLMIVLYFFDLQSLVPQLSGVGSGGAGNNDEDSSAGVHQGDDINFSSEYSLLSNPFYNMDRAKYSSNEWETMTDTGLVRLGEQESPFLNSFTLYSEIRWPAVPGRNVTLLLIELNTSSVNPYQTGTPVTVYKLAADFPRSRTLRITLPNDISPGVWELAVLDKSTNPSTRLLQHITVNTQYGLQPSAASSFVALANQPIETLLSHMFDVIAVAAGGNNNQSTAPTNNTTTSSAYQFNITEFISLPSIATLYSTHLAQLSPINRAIFLSEIASQLTASLATSNNVRRILEEDTPDEAAKELEQSILSTIISGAAAAGERAGLAMFAKFTIFFGNLNKLGNALTRFFDTTIDNIWAKDVQEMNSQQQRRLSSGVVSLDCGDNHLALRMAYESFSFHPTSLAYAQYPALMSSMRTAFQQLESMISALPLDVAEYVHNLEFYIDLTVMFEPPETEYKVLQNKDVVLISSTFNAIDTPYSSSMCTSAVSSSIVVNCDCTNRQYKQLSERNSQPTANDGIGLTLSVDYFAGKGDISSRSVDFQGEIMVRTRPPIRAPTSRPTPASPTMKPTTIPLCKVYGSYGYYYEDYEHYSEGRHIVKILMCGESQSYCVPDGLYYYRGWKQETARRMGCESVEIGPGQYGPLTVVDGSSFTCAGGYNAFGWGAFLCVEKMSNDVIPTLEPTVQQSTFEDEDDFIQYDDDDFFAFYQYADPTMAPIADPTIRPTRRPSVLPSKRPSPAPIVTLKPSTRVPTSGGCTLGKVGVGGEYGCSTQVALGLSTQILTMLGTMGHQFKALDPTWVHCTHNCVLQTVAADALVAVAKAKNDFITVNSAFRSSADQFLVYSWKLNQVCRITAAAVPGRSNHESGRGIDTSNFVYWMDTLAEFGWSPLPPEKDDPVHFDYLNATDISRQTLVAFQKLWNLHNPTRRLAEDGVYGSVGSQTHLALFDAPCDGWV